MNEIKNKKSGFTLAEVLITLSVLGVIAAITIPSIVSYFKKKQVEVRLKQTYSTLENVIERAKVENGGLSSMFESANGNRNYFVQNYILPYLNYTEVCDSSVSVSDCKIFPSDDRIVNLNGDIIGDGAYRTVTRYRIKLKNGTTLAISLDDYVLRIIVDVNGKVGANRFGYDTFYFTLLKPYSGSGCPDSTYCNKGDKLYTGYCSSEHGCKYDNLCNGRGLGCAVPIMKNGWKIPDDYPVKWF